MATQSTSDIESELQCPVCQELFIPPRNPKVLSCQHVVCEVCLPDIVERFKQCPECRTAINVPLEAIQTNLKLRNLAEIAQKQKEKALKVKLTRDGMLKKWEGLEPRRCHHTKEAAFFCCTCEEPICTQCLEHGHQLHDYETLDKMEREIGRMVEEIAREGQCLDARFAERTKQKEHVENMCKLEEQLIDRCVDEHIEECRRKGVDLKNDLSQQMQGSVNVLLQDLREITDKREAANVVYQKAQERNALPGERDAACAHGMDMSEKIKLKADLKKEIQRHLETLRQQALSTTGYERRRTSILIPHFVGLSAIEPDLGSYIDTQLRKSGVIDDSFLDASRVASCGNILAISDCKQHRVTVFCRKGNAFRKTMNISLVSSNKEPPHDVAVLTDGAFVVARKICLEFYSSSGWFQETVTTHINREQLADQTTGIRSVAAIESKPNWFYAGDVVRHEILEYNAKRECIRVIKITSRSRPVYMTAITALQIAITDSRKSKIEILDVSAPNAKELLAIDAQEARGISYDYKSKSLLVARSKRGKRNNPEEVLKNSGEIVQYCATSGRFVRSIVEGLYFPCGLVITNSGILVVTDVRKAVTFRLWYEET